jgi:hypothetical protein
MAVGSWIESPGEWDRLIIDDFAFDETEVNVDGDFGNDWDVKKAPGADGAPATNKGYEPCKPKITWVLWLEVHWETYQELLDKVQPRPGKTPPAVITVFHPQLAIVKKSKFKIAKVHTLKKVGPQQLEACFELIEHFDAPKPVPSPKPQLPEDRPERTRHIYDNDFFGPKLPSASALGPDKS